jgi:hypothetical protein
MEVIQAEELLGDPSAAHSPESLQRLVKIVTGSDLEADKVYSDAVIARSKARGEK